MKNFLALHERIATQIDDMVNNGKDIPRWMTTGKMILFQKDPGKGIAVDNYWPISCLPLMWKLMTGTVANSVYEYLEMYDLLPVEQKACRINRRGTKDKLSIDKMVLNDCKKRHTNQGMAWIDYKKAFDLIPHSWILEFIRKSMKTWNTNLTSCGEYLANFDIRRSIFHGDSLPPLMFVIV